MATAVAKTEKKGSAGRVPAPMASDLVTELAIARNGLQRAEGSSRLSIAPERMPTAALRQALLRRVEQLGADLDARGPSIIGAVVAKMFERLAGEKRVDDAAMRSRVNTWISTLKDLPPWCVAEACGRFSRGQVAGHNPAFPPTTAQVYQEAVSIITPWRRERQQILELLSAKPTQQPESLEKRQKIMRGLDELVAELKIGVVETTAEEKAAVAATDDPFAPYRVRRGTENDKQSQA